MPLPKPPEVKMLPSRSLVPYAKHPFKLYEGERLADMVVSIKEVGIITPIIIRPLADDKYQILSGHNRVNAAKLAGVHSIPAVIKENLTDIEAMLIVTETNMVQRSFSDLLHSEKAACIATHIEAIKQQGKRSDLLNSVHETIDCQNGKKLDSHGELAENYSLNKRNIARYLRISKLLSKLKELLDLEQIPFMAAVELSYISYPQQEELYKYLAETKCKLEMKHAIELRKLSDGDTFSADNLKLLFSKKKESSIFNTVKIKSTTYTKYFDNTATKEQVEQTIEKALAEYFERLNDK